MNKATGGMVATFLILAAVTVAVSTPNSPAWLTVFTFIATVAIVLVFVLGAITVIAVVIDQFIEDRRRKRNIKIYEDALAASNAKHPAYRIYQTDQKDNT